MSTKFSRLGGSYFDSFLDQGDHGLLSKHLGEGILMISTQVELPHDAQTLQIQRWMSLP